MATGIPLPGAPGQSFLGGVNTGSAMFSRLMQPILQREAQAQQEKQFEQQMALRRAAQGQAHALDPLRQKILQAQLQGLKQKNDPNYELNQFRAMQDLLTGGQSANMKPMSMPNALEGEGLGAFSPEGLQSAQDDAQMAAQNVSGSMGSLDALKQNPILRGYFKHKFGFDPIMDVQETPEQKRLNTLQTKIEFENYKNDLKNKAFKDQEKLAAEKDLPIIQNSIEGVDELLNIAKNNPDLFGHGFMPDRFAKTTRNKNFGTWQNLIADRIAGLEGKLSSRGSIVALKIAASLKPSHAESQEVAIGKLESMKKELLKQMNLLQELIGKPKSTYSPQDMVVVEGPNGREVMTYEQAQKLGAQ